MFRRLFLLWCLFSSSHSFAAFIFIEIPASSSQLANATAKISCNQVESTKTLYSDGDCFRNIFYVGEPGLYKVEITIKTSSGEILSDWATGYVNNETGNSKVSAIINPNCFSTTFSVFWVTERVINENDLYGLTVDTSLLKRITIHNMDSIASAFYDEGLNWYSVYDVHDEILDSNYIPLVKYSTGYFRNAITTCQTLLAFYNRYKQKGDSIDYRGFLNNANWLANNNHSGYYLFEFGFNHDHRVLMDTNWVSAMAQGYALGSLTYAYYITNDSVYLKEADSVFVTLHQNSSDFWCFLVDSKGYYWLEEYPSKDFCHVLNGKMAALWGIFQYYAISRNKLALVLFEAGMKSVVDHFRIWNVNNSNRSYYCLHHNIKDPYHSVHQTQLLAFANKFNIGEFYNAYYCFIDSNIIIEPEYIEINYMPVTKEVRIYSPEGWHVEEQADWLTTEVGDNILKIAAQNNLTQNIRSAIVEVIFDNGDRRKINITQEMSYYFKLNSVIPEMDSDGDTLVISYSSNVPDFEINALSDWLHIDKVNNTLLIICNENQSFESRDADLSINYGNRLLSNYTVNQKAKVPYIYLESDTIILNSPNTYQVSVKTNIPGIAFLTFENWLAYRWKSGNLLIRATDMNKEGIVYFDSPYLTREVFVVSGTFTSEKEVIYDADYSAFPNPVSDVLQLKAENSGSVSFEFKNMLGNTLQSGIMNESTSIDVSGYKPGVYFVVFQTSAAAPYVIKVLVSR